MDARAEGVIGLLKKVDRSFTVRRNNWVSRRDDREPLKRGRDFSQAKTVATVAVEYWRLAFDAKELSALPAHLVQAMLYSPRDAGDSNSEGTAMSVLDLMRLADVPLTIARAFEAGKLRFRRISPRSSEPNRWEIIDRRLAVPCCFPLRARLKLLH